MSTAEALCIKNTLTDQVGLGHLISKHEMFCFEKTVFKSGPLYISNIEFHTAKIELTQNFTE
jgi:hypothetical protein